jgi:hypothetical protein
MPEHARSDPPRRTRYVPAVAALAVAAVYSAFLGVTLERTRPAGDSVPDADQSDPPRPPVYTPEGLSAADRVPSVPGPSASPSQPLSSPFVGSAPTTHPTAPTAKPSPTPTGDGKDALRRGLDDVLPEVKNLPSWALPIVHKVQKHAVKGSTIQARVDDAGTLYVWGTVTAPKPGGSILGARFTKPGTAKAKPGKHAARVGVEILLTVEDPTKATPADPATVTVTALAPTADVPVVTTAQITDPTTATVDTVQTVRQAVADAVDSAPADPTPTPDPTPSDPPTADPGNQLAPDPTPSDPPTVDPAVFLLLRDQGPFVRHKEDVPHEGSLPDLYGL